MVGEFMSGDVGRYMGDLAVSWWVLLVAAGTALVLSILYLVLLRWIAKPMIYISLILTFLLMVGGGFYVLFAAYNYEMGDNTRNTMVGMAILIWILSFLFLCAMCCCWRNI
jgi:hypothetical protein